MANQPDIFDKEVFDLLYSHSLDDMIGFLPEIEKKLSNVKTESGRSTWLALMSICEEWTVYARYSPQVAKLDRAAEYLEAVKEVKKWL